MHASLTLLLDSAALRHRLSMSSVVPVCFMDWGEQNDDLWSEDWVDDDSTLYWLSCSN